MKSVFFLLVLIVIPLAARSQDGPSPPDVYESRIGVMVQDVTAPIRDAFGSPGDGGALVTRVAQGRAGYVAGVQAGDIFIAVDGVAVSNVQHFSRLLDQHAPGSRLEVKVWRQPYTVPLTVVVPASGGTSGTPVSRSPPRSTEVAGIVVRELAMADKCRLGVEDGLYVERASGLGAEAGIRKGDVILRANTAPVSRIADFYALAQQQAGQTAALLVHQGERSRYLLMRWPAVNR